MTLDPALDAAIREAASEASQPASVADRLIAWLEALGEGEATPEAQDAFYARLMGAVSAGEPR